MAVNPLSPGVYIDEISVFPPSVAPVATAVPAFIGYTEKGPTMVPTRITSMLDFETVFGGAYDEAFGITLATSPAITVDASALTEYTMHYHMRMYFANGGGPCYIVSVAHYDLLNQTITWTDLQSGIAATEKADEVTLLVVPESVSAQVSVSQRATLYNDMMALCARLKDRFALMDVPATVPAVVGSITGDALSFRNNTGLNNLKYGAAYYPSLNTLLTRNYEDADVTITDNRGGAGLGPFDGKTLDDVLNIASAYATGKITIGATLDDNDVVIVNGVQFKAKTTPGTMTPTSNPYEFAIGGTTTISATNLAAAITAQTTASAAVTAVPSTNFVTLTAKALGEAGNAIPFSVGTDPDSDFVLLPNTGTLAGGINADKTLYNNITAALSAYTMELYPSATMAGIYASVDRDRGVWKAPANVSLTGVVAPSVNISASDQENLNVDPSSGKSINAIRAFAGKGILAWGARTMAGNDSEWRYINVRRLFIFAEESIQKASEFVVFEPNDRNTWSRVNTLITNFLTNLWRDGALAGATAKDAFFVKVGLGETMTAQDILDGKLIIQVGLAAVRPAEFIILQFSHKLQES